MKLHSRFLLLITFCLTPALGLHAQTLLDDFSTDANWSIPSILVGTTGTFEITNSSANYVTSLGTTPGENEFSLISYTGAVGSYTSSWSVNVSVNYITPSAIFDSAIAQSIDAGLMVTTTGTTFFVNNGIPNFNAFLITSNLYQNESDDHSRDFRTSRFIAGDETIDGAHQGSEAVSGSTFATLTLSFDGTTKLLTASYDLDGAGGTAPELMGETIDTTSWNMATSDTFTISLIGNSRYDSETGSGISPTMLAGDVTFDNLVGTNLTAVPEPATYAAMFGAAVLGFALWRRPRTIR